jgi:hypothetical protein
MRILQSRYSSEAPFLSYLLHPFHPFLHCASWRMESYTVGYLPHQLWPCHRRDTRTVGSQAGPPSLSCLWSSCRTPTRPSPHDDQPTLRAGSDNHPWTPSHDQSSWEACNNDSDGIGVRPEHPKVWSRRGQKERDVRWARKSRA